MNMMIHHHPAELLRNLIRFDTTNPPGNERACTEYIQGLLQSAGIETRILARDPDRPNLLARIKGRGTAPPLLLYGHVDVVSTANQAWQHQPFAGDEADGFIWGRGALDMKGGVAMMAAAFLKAHVEQTDLPGDVLFLAVSDEENGGDFGARFIAEQHGGLFDGVRHAIGEFGGFSLHVGSRKFYPIQVAEKQVCWLRATLRGPAGHGSMPIHGGAMAKLGQVLQRLDRRRLPVRITEPVRQQLTAMAGALPGAQGFLLRQMLNPLWTDRILNMMGDRAATFDPILHNTVSPTMLNASDKVNVIPARVELGLDGRLLPGVTPAEMMAEIRAAVDTEIELEVLRYDPGPVAPDMSLFGTLAGILKEADPTGIPVPLVLPGVTDGRFFARLGIQTYGFLPMNPPPDFHFIRTIHAADERVPAECLAFGSNAIFKALQRRGG